MPSHKSAYIIHSTVLVSCQRRCQVLNKHAVSGGCEWRLTPTLRAKNPLPFQPALTFHNIHVRVRVVPRGSERLYATQLSPTQQTSRSSCALDYSSHSINTPSHLNSHIISLSDHSKCLYQWNFSAVSEMTQTEGNSQCLLYTVQYRLFLLKSSPEYSKNFMKINSVLQSKLFTTQESHFLPVAVVAYDST